MSFRTYISVVSYSYEIASFWISYLPDNCYSRQFVFLFFMQVWVRFWWNDIGVNTTLWWTSGYHNWIAELSSISGYILGSSIHRQPLIWNRVSSNRDFQCSLSWATLSTFSRGIPGRWLRGARLHLWVLSPHWPPHNSNPGLAPLCVMSLTL